MSRRRRSKENELLARKGSVEVNRATARRHQLINLSVHLQVRDGSMAVEFNVDFVDLRPHSPWSFGTRSAAKVSHIPL